MKQQKRQGQLLPSQITAAQSPATLPPRHAACQALGGGIGAIEARLPGDPRAELCQEAREVGAVHKPIAIGVGLGAVASSRRSVALKAPEKKRKVAGVDEAVVVVVGVACVADAVAVDSGRLRVVEVDTQVAAVTNAVAVGTSVALARATIDGGIVEAIVVMVAAGAGVGRGACRGISWAA